MAKRLEDAALWDIVINDATKMTPKPDRIITDALFEMAERSVRIPDGYDIIGETIKEALSSSGVGAYLLTQAALDADMTDFGTGNRHLASFLIATDGQASFNKRRRNEVFEGRCKLISHQYVRWMAIGAETYNHYERAARIVLRGERPVDRYPVGICKRGYYYYTMRKPISMTGNLSMVDLMSQIAGAG